MADNGVGRERERAVTPADVVDIVKPRQIRRTLRAHLRELGLTENDLKRQAKGGPFQSEKARALWLAMRHFGQEV
jgi:hypothetical protein